MDLTTDYTDPKIYYHGGNISQEAKRLGFDPNQLLDASASLVPFLAPQKLHQYICKSITNNSLRNYPDRTHCDLREAIAKWHQIDPDSIFPGNGAAELNTWSAREASLIGISGLPSPGFADYERALRCWNAPYEHLYLPLDWSSKVPQRFTFESNAKVLWITNPHNPTGQLWSRKSLETLLEKHLLIICDEAFLPLVPDGEKQSLIPLVKKYENLIVIRSLTKFFAIAGLRLGYAVSMPSRLDRWGKLRDPWPLNGLAIAAGTMLMNDHEGLNQWTKKIQDWVSIEGEWLQLNLKKIPQINPHPSSVNFQLIQGEKSLLKLREDLAKKKILLRECLSFPRLGKNWLRISLQTRVNNQKIVQAIDEIMS